MKTNNRCTVKDVARVAGVSKGTVDRVIHNRGDVSEESMQKVLQAIKEINYKPNLHASLLASNKHFRIAVMLPDYKKGEYWEVPNLCINDIRKDVADMNIIIETYPYNQFDHRSFDGKAEEMMASGPDAVLIAPVFLENAKRLTEKMDALKIPYIFIDLNVEDTNYLAYFGMPLFESGYLGASLLLGPGRESGPEEIGHFQIRRDNSNQSSGNIVRREGFMGYIREKHPDCRVYDECLLPYDKEYNFAVLDAFFEKHPGVDKLAMFNSRAYTVAEYLRERNLSHKILLGYDLLAVNKEFLKSGQINYLISQRTDMQMYKGIKALCDYLVFSNVSDCRDNYMPMDILTAYNIDYYTSEIVVFNF